MELNFTISLAQGDRDHMEDTVSTCVGQIVRQKSWKSDINRDKETTEPFAFFGLFDGHGGEEAALYAKQHLLPSITRRRDFWSTNDYMVLRAIKKGFAACNAAMLKAHTRWPKYDGEPGMVTPCQAGTTASVAFLRGNKLYTGHVGDSAIVLGSQVGGVWKGEFLTREHKPEDPEEKRRIYKAGGKLACAPNSNTPRVVWRFPDPDHRGPVRRSTRWREVPVLNMSRALGDFWSFVPATGQFLISGVPDVAVHTIDPNTAKCLILGSDGLWEYFRPNEVAAFAQELEHEREGAAAPRHSHRVKRALEQVGRIPLKSLAVRLVRYVRLVARLKKETMDNCSAVCVTISPIDANATKPMELDENSGAGCDRPAGFDPNNGKDWVEFDPANEDVVMVEHIVRFLPGGQPHYEMETKNCER